MLVHSGAPPAVSSSGWVASQNHISAAPPNAANRRRDSVGPTSQRIPRGMGARPIARRAMNRGRSAQRSKLQFHRSHGIVWNALPESRLYRKTVVEPAARKQDIFLPRCALRILGTGSRAKARSGISALRHKAGAPVGRRGCPGDTARARPWGIDSSRGGIPYLPHLPCNHPDFVQSLRRPHLCRLSGGVRLKLPERRHLGNIVTERKIRPSPTALELGCLRATYKYTCLRRKLSRLPMPKSRCWRNGTNPEVPPKRLSAGDRNGRTETSMPRNGTSPLWRSGPPPRFS